MGDRIKTYKDFKFKKKRKGRINIIYLYVMWMGGDADTEHPEKHKFSFLYSEYRDHLKEINEIIMKYKLLGTLLDVNHSNYVGDESDPCNTVEEKYGKELVSWYEDAPNDPQGDYEFKCSLDYIKLIGYDEEGTKFEAWV